MIDALFPQGGLILLAVVFLILTLRADGGNDALLSGIGLFATVILIADALVRTPPMVSLAADILVIIFAIIVVVAALYSGDGQDPSRKA